MFTRSTILDFTGKKLALSFIAHELVDGQRPPYVHLASTRRHSRDRFSQAFPVFRVLPLPCIILNENRRTKTGEAWERGYHFAVLWLFAKVFSAKIGGVASFGAAKASNPRKFSPLQLYFPSICISFLSRKFPAIRYVKVL